MEEQNKFESVLIALSNALTRIADSFTKFTSKYDGKQSNNNDSDSIIEAISQTTQESVKLMTAFKNVYDESQERQKVIENQKRKDGYLVALITVLGVALGIFAQSVWEYHRENIQQDYQEVQHLNTQIDEKQSKRGLANRAMTSIRSIRDIGMLSCRNDNYIGNPKKLLEQRLIAQYKLVDAEYAVKGLYDDKITNKLLQFLKLVDATTDKNICSQDSPTPAQLRTIQLDINNAMLDSIQKDKHTRKTIMKRIE